MTALAFPDGFLWGAATSAHQVEGENTASDWWEWERRPSTPCHEPSGSACEHYLRYAQDIALLAALGFTTYRFSVEWARIEPTEGAFSDDALAHYQHVVDCVRANGLVPMVTLNHFSLPGWVADQGGWTSARTPALFERYCRRVLETLGDTVPWYCTINEAAVLATSGYIGRWGFPPNVVDTRQWRRAIAGLVEGHQRAVAQVRQLRLKTKVGMALYTCEVDTNAGGRPAAQYAERMNQGIYLDAAAGDDFIGVQTYTRFYYRLPRIAAPLTRLALAVRPLERFVAPHLLGLATTTNPAQAASHARTTQMGWEYQPEAAAATVRRIAERYPDKDIIVTEHGIATANDHDRAEFITRGLSALHQLLDEGIRLRGYIHWSLLDNFEWAAGYRMTFGLVGVDRMTQQRTIRPSARLLGEIARTGRLTLREQA